MKTFNQNITEDFTFESEEVTENKRNKLSGHHCCTHFSVESSLVAPEALNIKKNSSLPASFFSNQDTCCHGNEERQKRTTDLSFLKPLCLYNKKRERGEIAQTLSLRETGLSHITNLQLKIMQFEFPCLQAPREKKKSPLGWKKKKRMHGLGEGERRRRRVELLCDIHMEWALEQCWQDS